MTPGAQAGAKRPAKIVQLCPLRDGAVLALDAAGGIWQLSEKVEGWRWMRVMGGGNG